MRAGVALIFGLWLTSHPAPGIAQDSDPHNAAKQALTQKKLDAVRAEIHALQAERDKTAAQKNDAVAALREQELKIAASARQLRELDGRLGAQKTRLDVLLKQRSELDTRLTDQRDALAALLRSAYAMGGDEQLKLLLEQDDIDSVNRMLAYYGYFKRARIGRIDGLLKDLDALAQVQSKISEVTARLQQDRDERSAQTAQLQAERDTRKQVLAQLDAKLTSQKQRIEVLGKNEHDLVQLLQKLRDIFADIPAQTANSEPFADLRGHLSWPLRGKVVENFGSKAQGGVASRGMMIATSPGTEVRAVAHGRVIYADWLRGYGLLMILDHGDGYMSLYGYNETLLKDVGDWVNAGDVIATSGDSGGRDTPGLYFELRHAGQAIDPGLWLARSSR